MLVARSRISLDRDVRVWVAQALAQDRVETIPLTADIALEAGLVDHHRFSGDPVDRILYATAQVRDALLATKDRNLRSFDRRRVVW